MRSTEKLVNMKFFTKIYSHVKDRCNPVDVYSSQRLLLNVSLIFGLIPYRLVKRQGIHKLETSVFAFIAAVVYMIFFWACFMFTIMNQLNVMEFFITNAISNFGGNLNLITSFLSITSVYLSSLYLRKYVKKMFAILTGIDEKLFELGIQVNHRNALIFNLKSFVVVSVIYAIFTVSSMTFLIQNSDDGGITSGRTSVLVTHFLPYLVLTILIFTFLNTARLIYTRFEATNRVSRFFMVHSIVSVTFDEIY